METLGLSQLVKLALITGSDTTTTKNQSLLLLLLLLSGSVPTYAATAPD